MTRFLFLVAALAAGVLPALGASVAAAEQPRMDHSGDPLPEGAIARLGTLRLRGCRGPVVFSPDGKYVVAAGGDYGRDALFWDRGSGRQVKALSARETIVGLVFSPDGKRLAAVTRGMDNNNPLWDIASGKELFTFRGKQVAFSAQGKQLVSMDGAKQPTVRCYDVESGKEGVFWTSPYRGIGFGSALSGDRRYASIALDGDYPDLVVFDLKHRTEAKKFRCPQGRGFSSFSPDGRLLLVEGWNGFRVFEWSSGKVLCGWQGRVGRLPAFSSDGRQLAWSGAEASGTKRDSVWLMEIAGGNARSLRKIPSNPNIQDPPPAFSPDGKELAVISEGGAAVLLDARTGRDLVRLDSHVGPVESVAFTADGRQVLTRDGLTALLWDARIGRLLRRFPDNLSKEEVAADKLPPVFLPPGRIWPEDADYEAMLKDRRLLDRDGKTAFDGRPGVVNEVHESPGSRYLGASGIRCGSPKEGRQGIAWLRLWDCVTRRLILDVKTHGDKHIAGFSPDGRTFVTTAHRTGTIQLWESATGRERLRLAGHLLGDVTIGFRPDGRVLVSGGDDTQVFLWDATGRTADGVARTTHHSPEQLRQLWRVLAGDDAAAAYRAIWELVDAPEQTVALLQKQLSPVAAVEARKLSRLIADLDSDEFTVRSKATEDLERLGEQAETALRKALAGHPTLECRRRCEALLAKLAALSGERLRAVRAVEVLEHINNAEARTLLEKCSRGVPKARLTEEARLALDRLAVASKEHSEFPR